MEENVLGCLWIWEQDTDYVLCNGDSDLLPTLVKKDEIRFEYNQWANQRSKASCTIFAAVWMLSDLMNYKFSYDEIKEIDEMSYERGRVRWQGRYVQSAVKLVADWWNAKFTEIPIVYYRLSKYDDKIIEETIGKLFTLDGNLCPTTEFVKDYKADWMVDGTDFGYSTNWHSVDVISEKWQRSVKDSYEWRKYNVYGLKNKLSAITNFGPYLYVYVPVNDKLEEIKRLNEMKTECVNCITSLWNLRHLTNEQNFKSILHYTADKIRDKIKTIDAMLLELK